MKHLRITVIILVAALSAACNKEQEKPAAEENIVVFTAQAPTKTSIDAADKVISWIEGDKVAFTWEGGSSVAQASASGTSTSFTVELDGGVNEVYAVYPAFAAGSVENGIITLKFAAERGGGSYASGDILLAHAVKVDGKWETSLGFINAACLVKVGVDSDSITRIQVESNRGEFISGNIPVSFSSAGTLSFGEVANGSSTINMAVNGTGNYYIPVLPGVTLENGFRVKGFEGENSLVPYYCYDSFETAAGRVFSLTAIGTLLDQYYVTPDGTGHKNGLSWDNAMDAAGFKAFVEDDENAALLEGSTFHFSAGEFAFGDYVQPSYPNSRQVSYTIEGSASGGGMTSFIGSTGQAAGTFWPKTNTNITIKGVTFRGTDGASNRTAIRINTGSAVLNLENCILEDNKTSGQGGAIAMFNGTLNVSNCRFENNSGLCGGALLLGGASVKVTVTDSEFIGNSAVGTDNGHAGAVLFIGDNGGTASFTGVTFKGNFSSVGTNEKTGGILRVNNDKGMAYFDHCVFDGNYSCRSSSVNAACAAIINSRTNGSYFFNACEFKNNASGTYAGTGSKYGMLIAFCPPSGDVSGGTLAMNNCSVHDNYGGRNTDPLDWIYFDNETARFVLANSSVIGDPTRKAGASASPAQKNGNGVIFLSRDAAYYFINNVLCSPTDGMSLNCASPVTIEHSYYNKTSPVNGSCDWGTDTGSGHDYYASGSCFGGWSAPYTWNGTLLGSNATMANTSDVNAQIEAADADFYAWLGSIGALGKDINGTNRGATSWPGCYQN